MQLSIQDLASILFGIIFWSLPVLIGSLVIFIRFIVRLRHCQTSSEPHNNYDKAIFIISLLLFFIIFVTHIFKNELILLTVEILSFTAAFLWYFLNFLSSNLRNTSKKNFLDFAFVRLNVYIAFTAPVIFFFMLLINKAIRSF